MSDGNADLDELQQYQETTAQGRTRLFSNAPWWVISAGLHVVLLLGAALVYVESLHGIETGPTDIVMHIPGPPKIVEFDLPRDEFTRKGIPRDEPNSPASNDEPIIFFPDAKPSDHNESDDNEDTRQMKGDSRNFLSHIPGQSTGFRGTQLSKVPGVYSSMGVGGGGGGSGRYGGRFGGRENLYKRGGGSIATESAVTAALKWLARHQNADGSWGASFPDRCASARCTGTGQREFDPGVTGLSLLAFLGAGYTQLSKPEQDPVIPGEVLDFGPVVRKGLQWLMAHQDPEGCLGERGPKHMYNHAIAALALCEDYGMTGAQVVKDPAQRSIDFLVASQNPGRGWRYSARCNDNDTSVTGWAVMALKSAELSELVFPRTAYDGAMAWLNEVTETNGYYAVGYNQKGTGLVYDEHNREFAYTPAMQAVAVMSRIFVNKKKNDPALGSVHAIVGQVPEWKPRRVDFYYWYYASLALFQYDGPKGPLWSKWNEPMKNALVPHQKTGKDACGNGSWDPAEDRWGHEGGRVYATAINALTLEVYYRYQNVFGAGNK